MINKFSPELFVQRSGRSDYQRGRHSTRRRNRRLMLAGGLLGLVVAMSYGIFSFLEEDVVLPQEIPHIEASLPIKERPDNPGGIDIPHQDMEVFSQLENRSPEKAESAVEHLLPPTASGDSTTHAKTAELGEIVVVKGDEETPSLLPPESEGTTAENVEPQNELPPAITEAVITDEPEAPAIQKLPEVIGEEEKPKQEVKVDKPVEAIKPQTVTQEQSQEEKAETAIARLPEELFTGKAIPETKIAETKTASSEIKVAATKTANTTPKAVAPTTTKKAPPKTGILARVQIASFPDKVVASREMSRYQKRFETTLGHVKLEIVRADITGRGTYFRIMTPLIDKAEADQLCAEIKRKNGSCLVKK